MRDLHLNEFVDELRSDLREKGVDLPRTLVYQMTKAFFKHAEKTAIEGKARFIMHHRDLTQVYPEWDVKRLCAELADGDNVLTANRLIAINKMQKVTKRYYKKMAMTASVEL